MTNLCYGIIENPGHLGSGGGGCENASRAGGHGGGWITLYFFLPGTSWFRNLRAFSKRINLIAGRLYHKPLFCDWMPLDRVTSASGAIIGILSFV